MALPEVHGTYRLVYDCKLKGITQPNGNSVHLLTMRVAASKSRYNSNAKKWEDVARLYIDVDYFGDNAHVLAGKLDRGSQVYIAGELVTDEWKDKATGESRSKVKIRARRLHPLANVPVVQPLNTNSSNNEPAPGQSGTGDEPPF